MRVDHDNMEIVLTSAAHCCLNLPVSALNLHCAVEPACGCVSILEMSHMTQRRIRYVTWRGAEDGAGRADPIRRGRGTATPLLSALEMI